MVVWPIQFDIHKGSNIWEHVGSGCTRDWRVGVGGRSHWKCEICKGREKKNERNIELKDRDKCELGLMH
jgi:hypothetical protein